jgi:hypothetical protein
VGIKRAREAGIRFGRPPCGARWCVIFSETEEPRSNENECCVRRHFVAADLWRSHGVNSGLPMK